MEVTPTDQFKVDTFDIKRIGFYTWDNGKLIKRGSNTWDSKVWVDHVLEGRYEVAFKVHSVNADLSGLVFGLWEENDADVSYFLTNRMVGINAIGTN